MKIKEYKTLASTNTLAKEIKNPKPWQVIWAREQTSGRGRKKNYWYSPQGGLYFSVILPESDIEDLQTLTILTAFVIAKIIKESFSSEPFIKLPNDIYLNQKKIGGVLTETVVGQKVKFCVIGIGLNTNIEKFPKELEDIATSLKIELGREVKNQKILKRIVKGIKEQLKIINQ